MADYREKAAGESLYSWNMEVALEQWIERIWQYLYRKYRKAAFGSK